MMQFATKMVWHVMIGVLLLIEFLDGHKKNPYKFLDSLII